MVLLVAACRANIAYRSELSDYGASIRTDSYSQKVSIAKGIYTVDSTAIHTLTGSDRHRSLPLYDFRLVKIKRSNGLSKLKKICLSNYMRRLSASTTPLVRVLPEYSPPSRRSSLFLPPVP